MAMQVVIYKGKRCEVFFKNGTKVTLKDQASGKYYNTDSSKIKRLIQ